MNEDVNDAQVYPGHTCECFFFRCVFTCLCSHLQPATATVTLSTVTMTPRWTRGEPASTSMDTTEGAESASTVRYLTHLKLC